MADQKRIDELANEAEEYRCLGLQPLPLDGKNPNVKDWPNKTPTPAVIRERLTAAQIPAIGVRMGPTSGIIDIEYDSPAQHQYFLDLFDGKIPDGPAFSSAVDHEGAHHLFEYDPRLGAIGKAVLKLPCGDGEELIIRVGSGSQSAFPPSPKKQWLPSREYGQCTLPKFPEAVIAKLIALATAKKPVKIAATGGVNHEALQAMLRHEPADDENDGSTRLFAVACRAVGFNLTDESALATIEEYTHLHPFAARQYGRNEILARIRDAEKKVERGTEVAVSNHELVDGDNGKKIPVPISMSRIIADIKLKTGDWPRRVDQVLFVDDLQHGIDYFDRRTTTGLFGYLRSKFQVRWINGGNFVSDAQLFAEVERTAPRYTAIETTPHEPLIDGVYYSGGVPTVGDGAHLKTLLDFFRPATTVDRELIKSAFITPMWGGLAGERPAYLVTTDEGRGVGKSKLAEAIGYLYGGAISVSANTDMETVKTRLLSPKAATKRVILLDNVKSLRLSWAELEAIITSSWISGRQNYVGEGTRPNLLTWYITLNGASLSTDMAQRVIAIKLTRGANNDAWWVGVLRFIDDHRQQILGDIIGALRSPKQPISTVGRQAAWYGDIVRRLADPDEVCKLILERQGEINCELEEAEIIEGYFADQLRRLRYVPETVQVRIPMAVVADWYGRALGGHRMTVAGVSKLLQLMESEGHLKRLVREQGRHYGRCYIWTGEAANYLQDKILNDLKERMEGACFDDI